MTAECTNESADADKYANITQKYLPDDVSVDLYLKNPHQEKSLSPFSQR